MEKRTKGELDPLRSMPEPARSARPRSMPELARSIRWASGRAAAGARRREREREEREGNEEGVRFDRSALLEGALRKISYEVFYAEKRQSSDFLFFA